MLSGIFNCFALDWPNDSATVTPKFEPSFESTAPSRQHWELRLTFAVKRLQMTSFPSSSQTRPLTPEYRTEGQTAGQATRRLERFPLATSLAALFEKCALVESGRTLVEEGTRAHGLFPGALLEPLRLDNFFAAEGTSHAARENCSTSQFTFFACAENSYFSTLSQ